MISMDEERKQHTMVNDIVIPRDTKLPTSITKDYAVLFDGQEAIDCSVTQSEGEERDVEFIHVIAKEKLELSKTSSG